MITDSLVDKAVFKKLKAEGIVIGFVDKLFGNSYSEALKALVHITEHASAIIAKRPDEYFKLMDQLSVLEGKAINLKGDLFELAVGYHYSQIAPYFEVNKNILEHRSGKRKEIDVFVRYSNSEVRIVECKGCSRPLDEFYVKKWLTDNIPIIRDWLLSQDEYSDRHLVFEIWSTGGFEDSARKLLKEYSSSVKKYSIRYYGKEEIMEIVRDSKNVNFQRIMNSYF